MRFSKKSGVVDQEKAEAEMEYAIEHGVNYFDTAYRYRGNEVALGKFLVKGRRKDVFLATKMPQFQLKTIADADRFFNEELSRLQTDYIDYYLMHMLSDFSSWERLKNLGIEEWIAAKKESGAIRNIGFSYHGGTDSFLRILEDYPWDFCQIQYNYMDETGQAGVVGLKHAAKLGIPVIIMEPLRGGRLADQLPDRAAAVFSAASPRRSPADWGLRWLFNQPEVTVVLSGMNSMAQIEENIAVAEETQIHSLTAEEFAVYDQAKEAINSVVKAACTGCGYCMPCPNGVDIPTCLRCYNAKYTDGWFKGLKEYFLCTSMKKEVTAASRCVGCGICEKACPQHLPVRELMASVKKEMETPLYHLAKKAADTLMRF
jgi:hypothetical protein